MNQTLRVPGPVVADWMIRSCVADCAGLLAQVGVPDADADRDALRALPPYEGTTRRWPGVVRRLAELDARAVRVTADLHNLALAVAGWEALQVRELDDPQQTAERMRRACRAAHKHLAPSRAGMYTRLIVNKAVGAVQHAGIIRGDDPAVLTDWFWQDRAVALWDRTLLADREASELVNGSGS